jgi:hypothetical protein
MCACVAARCGRAAARCAEPTTTATTDDDPNYTLTTTLNDSMLVVVQVAGHPLLRACLQCCWQLLLSALFLLLHVAPTTALAAPHAAAAVAATANNDAPAAPASSASPLAGLPPNPAVNSLYCLRPDGKRKPCGPGNEQCGTPFTSAPRYHVMDPSCRMNDPVRPIQDYNRIMRPTSLPQFQYLVSLVMVAAERAIL